MTGFVSRLSEEKNDLHNSLLKLEEEVRKYRQLSSSGEQVCVQWKCQLKCKQLRIKIQNFVKCVKLIGLNCIIEIKFIFKIKMLIIYFEF